MGCVNIAVNFMLKRCLLDEGAILVKAFAIIVLQLLLLLLMIKKTTITKKNLMAEQLYNFSQLQRKKERKRTNKNKNSSFPAIRASQYMINLLSAPVHLQAIPEGDGPTNPHQPHDHPPDCSPT